MEIIKGLMHQQIDKFRQDFINSSRELFFNSNSKKLIHPGEFGTFRENKCIKFLKLFLPQNFEIGTGFIVNNNNEISTQCDLVVYDKLYTPLINDDINQRFFPVETCVAIGEVKSVLDKGQFIAALNKLSKVKTLRDHIKEPGVIRSKFNVEYNPNVNHYDQLISFIICEKLSFNLDNIENEINGFYESTILSRHKHNLILSIEDGLFTYYSEQENNTVTIQYPELNGNLMKNLRILDDDLYTPYKLFMSYMYNSITSTTVLLPDMLQYMGSCDNQILKFER
jgi:hypothetical protein